MQVHYFDYSPVCWGIVEWLVGGMLSLLARRSLNILLVVHGCQGKLAFHSLFAKAWLELW